QLSFFSSAAPPRALHSFPPRRSSDLLLGDRRIRRRLQLAAHITRSRHAVVHLRVRCDGDLVRQVRRADDQARETARARRISAERDRKSTRLNSSHLGISYAVFCLKKK